LTTLPDDQPALKSRIKVRRIDYRPDEFLAGTSNLTLEETGAYWKVCSLIYSRGGPIENDDRWIAAAIFVDVRKWKPIKANLIAKGKLHLNEGKLSNGRCETEIQRALARINGAKKGAKARWGNGAPQEATPPRDVPEMSPEMSGHLPHVAPQVPTDIHTPLSSDNSELPNAAAYAAAHANSSTQQHSKEEEESPPPNKGEKTYAFSGKLIRLTQADFDQWQASYSAITDLRAQLQSDDDYYDRTLTGKARADWFRRESQKLCNLHQKLLAGQRLNGGANLNESF
jgi:uncharacterized protein YdaU (DUF1376 family)